VQPLADQHDSRPNHCKAGDCSNMGMRVSAPGQHKSDPCDGRGQGEETTAAVVHKGRNHNRWDEQHEAVWAGPVLDPQSERESENHQDYGHAIAHGKGLGSWQQAQQSFHADQTGNRRSLFPPSRGSGASGQSPIGRNLQLGRAVVEDAVNPLQVTRDAWRQVADRAGVKVIEIEILCSDPREHRHRIETRVVDIPVTWDGRFDLAGFEKARKDLERGSRLARAGRHIEDAALFLEKNGERFVLVAPLVVVALLAALAEAERGRVKTRLRFGWNN